MRILISNDDGYAAPGIEALAAALASIAEVTVVAPSKDRSATSNSITVHRALTVERAANGFYFLDGKPADCVHFALKGLLGFTPDLVVSGINNGANLGDDTIYSGTVAAAREGFLCGIPSIAFSMTGRSGKHFASGAAVAKTLVKRVLAQRPGDEPWLLNVNIPDLPETAIKGMRTVRLGKRHAAEPVERIEDDAHGRQRWMIGAVGPAADAGPDTDFGVIDAGYVSITPLTVDLTRHSQLPQVSEWIGGASGGVR